MSWARFGLARAQGRKGRKRLKDELLLGPLRPFCLFRPFRLLQLRRAVRDRHYSKISLKMKLVEEREISYFSGAPSFPY
jgi:hypothetical protein